MVALLSLMHAGSRARDPSTGRLSEESQGRADVPGGTLMPIIPSILLLTKEERVRANHEVSRERCACERYRTLPTALGIVDPHYQERRCHTMMASLCTSDMDLSSSSLMATFSFATKIKPCSLAVASCRLRTPTPCHRACHAHPLDHASNLRCHGR
jgi:hypothetical protein